MSYQQVPKAELHAHLEGTMTPILAKKIAARNQVRLPDDVFANDEKYAWKDFLDFIRVFDVVSSVIGQAQDYYDITYDYLANSAKEGVIYSEVMPSPDHAAASGIAYEDMLLAVGDAIYQAQKDFDIEAIIYITCVRHYGFEKCKHVAKLLKTCPNVLVRGFGMAGDELGFPGTDFQAVYAIAAQTGVGCTVHAGEWANAAEIKKVIDCLPISRLGHGVRVAEDEAVIQAVIDKDITLEVCPTSNIVLGVYPDFSHHPFLKLYERGVKVTLNSDDPPFFGTTIGNEYRVAQDVFGLDDIALKNITKNAIAAGFADDATKERLLKKLK